MFLDDICLMQRIIGVGRVDLSFVELVIFDCLC